MSSGGQVVGGIVGAAAGFVVGGPTGAIYGAQIGMSVGGLLDPPKGPTVEGPRLGDLAVQTSTYGQFIPRTYGTIGLSGNVFWLENNKIKEVVKKKKSGGKGGGSSSTVKTYTYFATFAVGLCEGPIAGVRRIWVGPDLVYDAGSDDLETIISSNNASSKFEIYLGTDTQQPDPRMQAEIGVSDCPAFRGLAYVVMKDLKLTNYGNSIAGAQVKVEVVNNQESTANIVDDISPESVSTFGQPSGGAFSSDFSGFSFLSSRAVGSESFREYIFKKYSEEIPIFPITSGRDLTYQAYSPYAFEDEKFYIFRSNDIFNTTKLVRQSDGFFTQVFAKSSFQNLRKISDFYYIGTYADNASSPGILNAVAHLYFANGAGGSVYISMGTTAGYRISSAGDTVHEYKIDVAGSIATVTVRTYTDSLVFSSSFSAQTSADGLYNVSSNESVYADGIKSFYLNGFIYLASSSGTAGSYRICKIGPDGEEFNTVISGVGAVLEPYHLHMVSESSGFVIGEKATQFTIFGAGFVPLSSIFTAESVRSSLISGSDIDESGLVDSVTGFKVTATGSIRNAIEPLRGAWPFDVVQSGYQIKATSRGSASVVTIPVGELAIDTQLTESREMDSQLPQNVTVKYIDRDRDYDTNEQRAQRDNTEAVNSLVLELPVVLSATQSAQVADKLIRIYALEKSDFSFTLPAPYRYLEPGDVVTIAATDADYVLRLVSVNQTADGRLECAGRPSSAATYTSIAPGDGGQQGAVTIPLAGATVGLIVDCPVIDEGLQDAPGFALGMNGYSAGWPGGILYRTADGGQTWDDLQALEGRATAGYAAGVLTASAGNLIQRGGSLTVSLIGGTLESVTEAQMLNGANVAAYGVNGRWEILRFQNATLNVDGTYTLDTFWRGDKGTEWATGLHAANDLFVLMTDPDLAFVGMPTDSIGQPRDYRAITAGAAIDSASSQSFTYVGVNLETLSGVHPRGSRSAGDLTITWQRRTRVGGAWRDYVDASLGESVQAYEVDIMSGATVKRTLSAITPSVLYTSAMQVTDFGSPQASVTVNIYQLSAVVGRGYKLEATL